MRHADTACHRGSVRLRRTSARSQASCPYYHRKALHGGALVQPNHSNMQSRNWTTYLAPGASWFKFLWKTTRKKGKKGTLHDVVWLSIFSPPLDCASERFSLFPLLGQTLSTFKRVRSNNWNTTNSPSRTFLFSKNRVPSPTISANTLSLLCFLFTFFYFLRRNGDSRFSKDDGTVFNIEGATRYAHSRGCSCRKSFPRACMPARKLLMQQWIPEL